MKITIEVSDRFINGALSRPGSSYWCKSAHWVNETGMTGGHVVERDNVRDVSSGPARHELDASSLERGLTEMFKRFPQTHFARLAAGTYDAETGDALLRLMAFGELKYG